MLACHEGEKEKEDLGGTRKPERRGKRWVEEQQEAMMKVSKPGWKPRASRLEPFLLEHTQLSG